MLRTARWVTGSFVRDFVLFALVWVWMMQLLGPFAEATAIPKTMPFTLFLGCLFAVDLLFGSRPIRFLLKIAAVIAFIYSMYYRQYESLIDPHWLLHWFRDLYFGLSDGWKGPLDLVAESVRTTLFFVCLWMLQSFFRQSLRSRLWMFAFVFLGATGLGMLDSFFVESAKWQTVLFVLIGLLILAFMQLPAIERVARMPQRIKGWPLEWLVWTLILSLVVVGASALVPKKQDPSWPDPVAILQGKHGSGDVRQKIGYGNDDSNLGGPFEMDDTPVFQVITNAEGYYRGETKAVYTGKGWESSEIGIPVANPSDITPLEPMEGTTLETKQVVQTYTFMEEMLPRVFSQYRMTGVTEATANVRVARYSPRDTRLDLDVLPQGTVYKVVSQVPYFDQQKVGGANIPAITPALRPYLQIPASLPRRVADLARQITQDAKTPYERATALESYMRANYNYNTDNVPVPGTNQDFVDQFLFDSKIGYCDHFSSSMVVMARTLGMPARWVKGFTSGDVDGTYRNPADEDEYRYTVRNKNAHSWAEIYFEGVGWVSFEPTATFQMPQNYKETPTSAPLPIPGVDTQRNQQEEETDQTTDSSSSNGFTIDWKQLGVYALYLAGLLLAAAFLFRRKLVTSYYIRRAYKGEGNDAVFHALVRLLLVLDRFGWKRQQDMTLREYAAALSDSHELRGREMIGLTKLYEGVRYGRRDASDQERLAMRDLWNRLIRKAGRFKKKR